MLPNLQENADLVTFTEEILNGILRLLCIGKREATRGLTFTEKKPVDTFYLIKIDRHRRI